MSKTLTELKKMIDIMPSSRIKTEAELGYLNLLTLEKLSEAMAKPEVKDEN